MVDLSQIYSKNGDTISKQYCGSKAMHGTSMKMGKDGALKIDSRNDNHLIFTKRFFNNVMGKDMKKQSSLSLITGHFNYKDMHVHPWKIDFIAQDVNFDTKIHTASDLSFESLHDLNREKMRELELDGMFKSY